MCTTIFHKVDAVTFWQVKMIFWWKAEVCAFGIVYSYWGNTTFVVAFLFVGFRSFHRKRHRHNYEGLWCYFRGYNWFAKLFKMLYFPNWYGDSYHMVFFYILCKNTISNTSPWTCVGKNVPWTSILCILVTFTHVQIEGTRIWTFFVLKKMLDRSALRTLNM